MQTRRDMIARALALFLIVGCSFARAQGENPRNPGTTIQQVGLVWLKQAGDAGARQKVVDAVHEFARSIPEVESASVGETDGEGGPFSDTSYDVCFILTFRDEAARQRYNAHPVHKKAAQEVFLPLAKKLLFYRFIAR